MATFQTTKFPSVSRPRIADFRALGLAWIAIRVTDRLGAFFWREAATFVGDPLTIAGALL